jgi:hypothetical protein
MKSTFVILACAVALCGCGQRQSQHTITGQVFIATKGGANAPVAGQEVCLVNESNLFVYVASKANEWSNSLEQAKAEVAQAQDESALHEAVRKQARLFDQINFPAPHSLIRCCVISTFDKKTDLDGRFKFNLPAASDGLMVVIKAERQVFDKEEESWWAKRLYLSGTNTEVILTGKDEDPGLWVFSESANSPFLKYLSDYRLGMEQAAMEREHAAWEHEHEHAVNDAKRAQEQAREDQHAAFQTRLDASRLWQLKNGAQFLGIPYSAGTSAVIIQLPINGSYTNVPLNWLTEADQGWVEDWKQSRARR